MNPFGNRRTPNFYNLPYFFCKLSQRWRHSRRPHIRRISNNYMIGLGHFAALIISFDFSINGISSNDNWCSFRPSNSDKIISKLYCPTLSREPNSLPCTKIASSSFSIATVFSVNCSNRTLKLSIARSLVSGILNTFIE